MRSIKLLSVSLGVSASVAFPCLAAAQSFKDVPASHPAYAAVEYLKNAGVVTGYADGTFQPNKAVNRAEALKLILTPVVPAEGLKIYTKTPFTDVPQDAWYLPYVEAARASLRIVSGPPDKTMFLPGSTVKRAEFLKMYLLTQRADVNGSYAELKASLSSDVPGTEWHFPYVRYALANSMITVDQQGLLKPGADLTRGDIALMMYRGAMYSEGRRTQSLLSTAESDMVNVMSMIEQDQLEQAEFAAARALIATRGALAKRPDEAIVKGAVKTAEGFQLIAQSYRAGKEGRLDDSIALAGQAWEKANKAKELAPSLNDIATQMQTIAKKLADGGRAAKG